MAEELWAELEAVRQLKARYFRLMDTKQWDIWRTLFTDDLIVEYETAVKTFGESAEPNIRFEGADVFVEAVKSNIRGALTAHHGHMPEIELTSPTTARGVWAMEDVVEIPGQWLFHGYGHYHETYRKEGADWRIATLRLTRLWQRREPVAP